jgi:hypothetical protein
MSRHIDDPAAGVKKEAGNGRRRELEKRQQRRRTRFAERPSRSGSPRRERRTKAGAENDCPRHSAPPRSGIPGREGVASADKHAPAPARRFV